LLAQLVIRNYCILYNLQFDGILIGFSLKKNMHKSIVEAVVVGEPDAIYVTIPFIFIVIQNAFLEHADQTIHELKSLLEAKLKLHLATSDVPIHYLVTQFISFFSQLQSFSNKFLFFKGREAFAKNKNR
jgi:hypothetical protein